MNWTVLANCGTKAKDLEVHQEEPEISEMFPENFFESGQLIMDVIEPQPESLPNTSFGKLFLLNF